MKLFGFFKKRMKSPPAGREEPVEEVFRNFVRLLKANNEALELMADMEEKASGRLLFDLPYILRTTILLAEKVRELLASLAEMDPKKYEGLMEIYRGIYAQIQNSLERIKPKSSQAGYTIDFHQVCGQMWEQVGGKAAHLGEVVSKLGLPVPDGFVVTTQAYREFLSHNQLPQRIQSRLTDSYAKGREFTKAAGEEIRGWIRQAQIPAEMEAALQASVEKLCNQPGRAGGLVLRSSAVVEDGCFSFAGQYATFLNISPTEVAWRYKEIAASQFSAPALFYMENKGFLEEEMAMAVLCQNLIRAKASGILFTAHWDPAHGETVLVNGVWGLGKLAVDGTLSPDLYVMEKKGGAVMGRKISVKETMLVPRPEGGIQERPVPEDLSTRPCLEPATLATLFEWALILEGHFHHPQDAEWALSEEGQLYLLQTRNLRPAEKPEKKPGQTPSAQVLLEGGIEASYGAGSGPIFLVRSEEDLDRFPPGSVLVAVHASPKFVAVMDKAAAIVTDIGSATGHMAILAREFQIPALVDTRKATQVLETGQQVTVDTFHNRVYGGRLEELLENRPPRDSRLRGTPVWKKLQEVLKLIAPLHLTDPRSPDFKAGSCRTFHDLTRFAHEMAVEEMFRLGERSRHLRTVRIKTPVPLNLYAFDLGGGFGPRGPKQILLPEEVESIPFQALWKGITHPNVRWAGPVGIDIQGLLSVMSQSTTRPPEDSWDRTLALVATNYLHFNSRLGYHYATVDSYCGPNLNDNYITFLFQGGAADDIRRGRRARFIGKVLERLGFEVTIKEDLARAQYRKFPSSMVEEKLDYLGRLMGCARLLDMTLSDEKAVDRYIQSFFSGEYSFQGREEKAEVRSGS
jgi:pyruvate,water dikinase